MTVKVNGKSVRVEMSSDYAMGVLLDLAAAIDRSRTIRRSEERT